MQGLAWVGVIDGRGTSACCKECQRSLYQAPLAARTLQRPFWRMFQNQPVSAASSASCVTADSMGSASTCAHATAGAGAAAGAAVRSRQ